MRNRDRAPRADTVALGAALRDLRRATAVGVSLVLCSLAVAGADDDYPVLVYPAPRAATPPQLDGRLTDACWNEAPAASGFTHYDRPELVPVQTTVRFTFDDDFLYVGVACDEPRLDLLRPLPLPRDSRQVFSSEAVEVFLDGDHDQVHYVQIAANAAGSIYDGRGQDPSWNSGTEAAAAVDESGWRLELRVPWRRLEVTPTAGTLLGANVCRDRTLKERQWSNWSQTKANFHDPERFASLVLAPTPEQLVVLQAQFRKGGRSGPLRILSRGGIGGQTYHDMAAHLLAEVDARLAELRQLRDGETGALRVALDERLAAFEARLQPLRARLAGTLDGGRFTRLELGLSGLQRELSELVWQARLDALLSSI